MDSVSLEEKHHDELGTFVKEYEDYSKDHFSSSDMDEIRLNDLLKARALCTDIRNIQNRNFDHIRKIEKFFRADAIGTP